MKENLKEKAVGEAEEGTRNSKKMQPVDKVGQGRASLVGRSGAAAAVASSDVDLGVISSLYTYYYYYCAIP